MTLDPESQTTVEAYLATLRKQLRDLMDEDVRDIVGEIRVHILDKASGDAPNETVAKTLTALGTPEQLALRYRTNELLQHARLSRSPAMIARWAALSVGGMLVFMLSGIGYCIGGILVVMALLKAFFPREAGLNITHDGQSWGAGFGAGSGPHTGHDPIGLWLIPICLVLGGGILFVTFRFGTWCLSRFGRPRRIALNVPVEE
jgi:hypothetical protein